MSNKLMRLPNNVNNWLAIIASLPNHLSTNTYYMQTTQQGTYVGVYRVDLIGAQHYYTYSWTFKFKACLGN